MACRQSGQGLRHLFGCVIALICISLTLPGMRSPWNVFDFVLILAIWISITTSSIFDGNDDAGFALSVLRTLRLMRFFAGIRELMRAVALGYKTLFTILALLGYAYVITAVAGMELFGGIVVRAQHGLPSKNMALITSDYGIVCSLHIKWPASPRVVRPSEPEVPGPGGPGRHRCADATKEMMHPCLI